MKQVNFVVIFVICLALVLFGIENTTPSVIHVVKGVDFEAPLSVELIVAAGIGATLAWVFSVWVQLQAYAQQQPEIARKEERIQELEQDVERYRVELEQLPMLPQANADS
ncbi:MAG: lipopolysaccharide assembly protein LapA domain-containing protein [Cyanobacteria bacterium J06560_5]